MAKQLNRTTSIARIHNNRIHGFNCGQHATFNTLHDLIGKLKPRLINIWGVDWTSSIMNHFNQQMLYQSYSLDSISSLAITVGLKIIRTSLEHFATVIFSNLFSSSGKISHARCTLILNRCTVLTRKVREYTAWSLQEIGGGILTISFLPELQCCQLFVHLTRTTRQSCLATSMPGCYISRLVIFDMICSAHYTMCHDSLWADPVWPKGANNANKAWHSGV